MKTKFYSLLLFLFCLSFIGYSQTGIGTYPAVDGGFENHTTTLAGGSGGSLVLSSSLWTTNTTGSIVRSLSSTGGRTGPKFVSLGATNGTAKTFFSPQMPGAFAPNTTYQVQFWYKGGTVALDAASVDLYVDNSSTTAAGTKQSTAVTLLPNTSTWTKVNAQITTSAVAASTNGIVGLTIDTPTAGSSIDFDDFIIYQGSSADTSAPLSPGAITATGVTAGANVSWGAASGGVDGGGYVVVRYAVTAPSASDDPLQNGIYSKGNIVGAGEVRYIGSATSFADTGLSPGVDYYYKVYTVDKAFNYSNESTSTAVQSLATTYYYNGVGLLTDLASWGQNINGTGTTPANFTDAAQVFEIRNTTAVALDGAWVVGASNGTKVRLGNVPGITLTLNSGASIGPGGSGNFDVLAPSSGNHTVIYKGITLVSFGNIFDTNLEVIYDGVLVTTSSTKSFGTVTIKNGADVSFSAAVTIDNLAIESGSTGTFTSLPTITNMTVNGSLITPTNASTYITIPNGGSVVINGTVRVPKLTGFVSSGVTPSSAGGDIQFIGTENLTLGANSIVEYTRDATSSQNITARTDYKNLILSGTVPKTINGPTTVAGTLTINQTAPATAVTMGGDLTVNGNLTFVTAGNKVNTGANTLTIGTSGTITGASQTNGWIVGNLKKLTASSASPSFTYDLGDINNHTPLALTFSGNTSAAGGLTVKINTGDHPQIATSGIDGTKSVNKYWTLTNDALAGFGTYNAAFKYTNADIDGISTPANYLVKLYDGATWSSVSTSGTPTDTDTMATGISGFGDFSVGEINSTLSINDSKFKTNTLFPNPVNDGVLYLSSDNNSDKSIEIYDSLGKKVFSSTIISNSVEIKTLKTGVYLARIKTDKEVSVQKIMINN